MKDITKQGNSLTQWRVGRRSYFPLFFFSKDSGLEGVSSPYALAAVRVALQARLLYLHTHN
jgi:hypothetical protein